MCMMYLEPVPQEMIDEWWMSVIVVIACLSLACCNAYITAVFVLI